jgi:hypothetical protein
MVELNILCKTTFNLFFLMIIKRMLLSDTSGTPASVPLVVWCDD